MKRRFIKPVDFLPCLYLLSYLHSFNEHVLNRERYGLKNDQLKPLQSSQHGVYIVSLILLSHPYCSSKKNLA